jgi:hypothetical protein
VVLIQIWGVKFENIQPELLWKKEVIIGNETGNETRYQIQLQFGVCIFSNGSECEE